MKEPYLTHTLAMIDLFIKMFNKEAKAFFEGEVTASYEIANSDELIDAAMKRAFESLPSDSQSDRHVVSDLLQTFNIIRAIERAGDHTKNICEATVFKVKGKKIDLG